MHTKFRYNIKYTKEKSISHPQQWYTYTSNKPKTKMIHFLHKSLCFSQKYLTQGILWKDPLYIVYENKITFFIERTLESSKLLVFQTFK